MANDLKDQIFDYLVKDELLNYTDYDIETIKNETEIAELGLDSLDMIETIIGAEEKYNIEIQDDDFEHVKTVGELVEVIYNNMRRKNEDN